MKNLSTLDTKLSTLILALSLTSLCASCRAKKEIAAESRADIDSVAATVASAYNLRIDSAMRHINFDFDTLEITIERHAPDTATTSIAEPPDTTRIFLALGTLVIIVSGIFIYLRRRR